MVLERNKNFYKFHQLPLILMPDFKQFKILILINHVIGLLKILKILKIIIEKDGNFYKVFDTYKFNFDFKKIKLF